MEIRGERECKRCGTQWSYAETGSPECPNCGSRYSVGVGERAEHTDRPADLDLEASLSALAEERLAAAGRLAADAAREYVHRRGFVAAGELRPLSARYVLAQEVRQVGQRLRTATPPTAETVDLEYAKRLFEAAATGELPPPAAVPETMAGARGLAVAAAVADYRRAIRSRLDADADLERALDRLDSHVRRVRALDGAIEPETASQLLQAAQTAGAIVRGEADRTALERDLDRLDPR
jgi:predicted  nucleic acid-binding Zn-ribbon protein